VKAAEDMEAMNFIATAPHVKVEAVGGMKYTRLQEVQCSRCQAPFYLWSPTLNLNASQVKAQADWLVKYLTRTCNKGGPRKPDYYAGPITPLGSAVITKVVDISDKKG
jgi:hypothetical protein